jgi:hypothetical protein
MPCVRRATLSVAGRRVVFTAFAATALAGLVGCRDDERAAQPVEEGVMAIETASTPELVEWVVYEGTNADLLKAERALNGEETRDATAALIVAADRFHGLAKAADGEEDAHRLMASSEELRALATDFPEDILTHRRVLGEVEGRALVALSRHHLLMAGRFIDGGDGKAAGRHLRTAAENVAEGFRVSGGETPRMTESSLDALRVLAIGWMDGMAFDPRAAVEARRSIGEEADRLANVLGPRHP